MPTRHASARWEGNLRSGKGSFDTQAGLKSAYSFATRFGDQPGSNPEELLAAAEAACYSMALSLGLEQAGSIAERVDTRAECTIDKRGENFRITAMKLTVRAKVPGLAAARFAEIAEATRKGCPISAAIDGNVPITLDAQLV